MQEKSKGFKDVLEEMMYMADGFIADKKDAEGNSDVQKMMSVSTIIEFINCGADIRILPMQAGKIPVVIYLKRDDV